MKTPAQRCASLLVAACSAFGSIDVVLEAGRGDNSGTAAVQRSCGGLRFVPR